MRDYVLPDFSSIKKGFCKVSNLAYYEKKINSTLCLLLIQHFFFSLCFSLERKWILQANIRLGSRFCGSPMRGLQSQRCSFTPLTSAFRGWAYLRLWSTPLTTCRKVDFIWLHLIRCVCGLKCYFIESTLINAYFLCPEMQPHFYKNIVLTGGNTLFPGFRDRVYKEVRALAPVEYEVSVVLPPKYVLRVLKEWLTFCLVIVAEYFSFVLSPICYPWEGGKLLAENPDFEEMVVTRDDYEENGHYVCEEKFDIWPAYEWYFGTENLSIAHVLY